MKKNKRNSDTFCKEGEGERKMKKKGREHGGRSEGWEKGKGGGEKGIE